MTAVVQNIPVRNGWSHMESSRDSMASDSRNFTSRRSAQRSNSSSSLATIASSKTVTAPSNLANGTEPMYTIGPKKKSRGMWPSSKSQPVATLSDARSQSVPPQSSAQSAASSMTALQHSNGQLQAPSMQSNTMVKASESNIVLILQPTNGTFDRKSIIIPNGPEVIRVGRQTNQKTLPTPSNGFFDSKVLSRQHAELWADKDGKINIRDVGSSNGTFVNAKRLSLENKTSETEQLKEGDLLELGIDIVSEDQKTVVHHKVAARVEFAGARTTAHDQILDLGLESSFQSMELARGQHHGNPTNGKYPATSSIAIPAAPYHSKWLQPVTMEQIVKRLQAELKLSRSQNADINTKASIYEATIPDDPGSQPKLGATQGIQDPMRHQLPTTARSPELARSETEKPNLQELPPDIHTGPPDVVDPVTSLSEALANARQEIELQSDRIKEYEKALQRERKERKAAEELATQLALRTADPLADVVKRDASIASTLHARDTSRDAETLIGRLSLMKNELDGMKSLMSQYKRRAESAERVSARERRSLQELVDCYQRREVALERRGRLLRDGKHVSTSAQSTGDSQLQDDADKDMSAAVASATSILYSDINHANGFADSQPPPESFKGIGRAASASADGGADHVKVHRPVSSASGGQVNQIHLAQTAPYASLIGVVLLGVGIMSYLNSWQKITDR